MYYTENELAKLIESVEKEFRVDLAKAEELASLAKSETAEVLAKAEDDKKPPEAKDKEAKPDAEKKPEAEAEAEAKPEEKQNEAPKGEEKAAPPGAEEHKEAAPAEGQENGEAGHDYDQEDLDHMHKMYMSMGKPELLAHHDAVRKCLDNQGAAEQSGEAQMAKSETVPVIEVKPEDVKSAPNAEMEMLKSEIEASKAKADTLQKTLDGVTEFLTKLATKSSAPKGKAVTSYDVIAKSEDSSAGEQPMTKSEILGVLSKKAMDPSLSKSDREAINAFYLNNASVNSISHLLK